MEIFENIRAATHAKTEEDLEMAKEFLCDIG
jgi:hypothetical protein